MTIRYSSGTSQEGLLLSASAGMMRVAVRGVDDALAFYNLDGAWIAESCETVEIEMEWQRNVRSTMPDEADYLCPQELAALLMQPIIAEEAADPDFLM